MKTGNQILIRNIFGVAPKKMEIMHGLCICSHQSKIILEEWPLLFKMEFIQSGAEGKIREELIKNNIIECVIGLAENLFYGTGIGACLLVINKKAQKSKPDGILLINAELH